MFSNDALTLCLISPRLTLFQVSVSSYFFRNCLLISFICIRAVYITTLVFAYTLVVLCCIAMFKCLTPLSVSQSDQVRSFISIVIYLYLNYLLYIIQLRLYITINLSFLLCHRFCPQLASLFTISLPIYGSAFGAHSNGVNLSRCSNFKFFRPQQNHIFHRIFCLFNF